ncbi:MAG: hypothetical protein QOH00_1067, partial [Gaiellales bacterium]|nr:hypothetical protein [Gaiellales bacterium]
MSALENRARRRRRARRRTVRRRVGAALVVGLGAIAALVVAFGSSDQARQGSAPDQKPGELATSSAHGGAASEVLAAQNLARPAGLSERRIGTLPAPLEDAGAAAVGPRVVLAGGLTAQDTSTRAVIQLRGGSARTSRDLPAAQHDAPAVGLGGSVYVFGGGDGIRQLDHILRIDSRSGRVAPVGRLPAASSDASAATVGSTAYVVGGYTGTRWLDTVVAFRAGRGARIVAHLPVGVRYAAVAAAGTSIVIAGGSLADGSASRAVYRFDPRRGIVKRIGSLPAATTHAAAASLGGTVFVIGGRGTPLGSVSSAI